jgi:dihydrofolate synthase/folylpolyglutamate synthase
MQSNYLKTLRNICQPVRAADYPRSLDALRRLLHEMGNPHRRYPALVVAGSVGKGTTTAHTAALLQSGGFSIGLYTGPHLHHFRERFQINGEPITPGEFAEEGETLRRAVERTGQRYSTFEQATALALWWFAQARVDLAVLEVGIGGSWDAVNVVTNAGALITPIEMEHAAMLGGSLHTIAFHKAGIIQPDGSAFSAPQSPVVEEVLRDVAESLKATLTFAPFEQLPENACESLMARGILNNRDLDSRVKVRLPGRLEVVMLGGRQALIDGGHTALAGTRLRARIDDLLHPEENARLVVGMLDDKDIRAFLRPFDEARFTVVLTQAPGQRGAAPDSLRERANLQRARVIVEPELNTALAELLTAPESLPVVAGSLRMAAAAREAFGLLNADELEEARITRSVFEGEDYLARLERRTFT